MEVDSYSSALSLNFRSCSVEIETEVVFLSCFWTKVGLGQIYMKGDAGVLGIVLEEIAGGTVPWGTGLRSLPPLAGYLWE